VVSEKQKEQLQKLEAENTTLLSQLNEQKIKVVSEFPATQVDLFELPLTKYF
jgi:hypothetical protein